MFAIIIILGGLLTGPPPQMLVQKGNEKQAARQHLHMRIIPAVDTPSTTLCFEPIVPTSNEMRETFVDGRLLLALLVGHCIAAEGSPVGGHVDGQWRRGLGH